MKFEILFIKPRGTEHTEHEGKLRELGFEVVPVGSIEEARTYIQENQDRVVTVVDGSRERTASLHPDIPQVAIEKETSQGPDFEKIRKIVRSYSESRRQFLEESLDLIKGFAEESLPILGNLENILLGLEGVADPLEPITEALRILHTLKGTAASVGLHGATELSHKFEDHMIRLKEARKPCDAEACQVLLKACDALKQILEAAREGRKVSNWKAWLSLFSENQAVSSALCSEPPRPGGAGSAGASGSIGSSGKTPEDEKIQVPLGTLDEFIETSSNIAIIRRTLLHHLKVMQRRHPGDRDTAVMLEAIKELNKENLKLQQKSEELRRVSFGDVMKPLKRTVKDLSLSMGKKVLLQVEGESVYIDRTSAKLFSGCLIHLFRNSMDHGIETPEDREKAQKPGAGTIRCALRQTQEDLHVEVSDDGRGMDPAVLRRKAVEKGVYSREKAASMPDGEIIHVIFEPGFSTASTVSDVSGRGVGMDMVKSSILAAKGRYQLQSSPGKGMSLRISVPIPKSMALSRVYFAEVHGQTYAILADQIVTVLNLRDELRHSRAAVLNGGFSVSLGGRYVNVIDPIETLKGLLAPPELSKFESIVVLSDGSFRVGVLVTRMSDVDELPLKDLDPFSRSNTIFSKVCLLDSGGIGPVLNCEALRKIMAVTASEAVGSGVTAGGGVAGAGGVGGVSGAWVGGCLAMGSGGVAMGSGGVAMGSGGVAMGSGGVAGADEASGIGVCSGGTGVGRSVTWADEAHGASSESGARGGTAHRTGGVVPSGSGDAAGRGGTAYGTGGVVPSGSSDTAERGGTAHGGATYGAGATRTGATRSGATNEITVKNNSINLPKPLSEGVAA